MRRPSRTARVVAVCAALLMGAAAPCAAGAGRAPAAHDVALVLHEAAVGPAAHDVALVLHEAAVEYRSADATHDLAIARRARGLVAAARAASAAPGMALVRLDASLRATRDRLQPWPFVADVERRAAQAAVAAVAGPAQGAGPAPAGAGAPAEAAGGAAAATLADVARTLDDRRAGPARLRAALAWVRYARGPRPRVLAQDPLLDARIAAALWATARTRPGLVTALERGAAAAPARARLGAALASAEQSLGEVPVGRGQIVADAAVLVFREGLEAVLILAAITASFVGARRRLRRPVLLGALAGLGASVLTWVVAQTIVRSLGAGGLRLQAVTGLLAIGVLLLVTNWFFHRIYWSEWIARFNRRRKLIERIDRGGFLTGQAAGFVALGLTSVYREGFETVLFLQSLQVSAGTGATLLGTGIGLAATALVGGATFVAQRKLPYRRMLVATGALIALVLAVMVGTTAHTLQGLGWLPATPSGFVVPRWCTTWLGIYATWESLALQAAALAFVVGSYALARELQVKRPRRRARRAAGQPSSARATSA
jgi:FTR1 family protein